MASASVAKTTPASVNGSLNITVPAVAKCISPHDQDVYLGLTSGAQPCSVILDMHFDEIRNTFSCKLRIPIKVKSHANKIYLYLLFEPKCISSLQSRHTDVPQEVINTFVTRHQSSSLKDITGLCLSFSGPGTVVAPKNVVEPRSMATRGIVDTLLLLKAVDHLTIYCPSSPLTIDDMVWTRLSLKLAQGCLSSVPVMQSLYTGDGGRVLQKWEDLLQTSSVSSDHDPKPTSTTSLWDAPPPYDQPPALKRRKEGSSSGGEGPPAKRRELKEASNLGSIQDGVSENWKRAMTEQMALLTAKVASISAQTSTRRMITMVDAAVQTDEVLSCPPPPPSTCSTVEDSLEDRLLIAEHKVAELDANMARMRELCKGHVAEAIRQEVEVLTVKLNDNYQGIEDLDERLNEVNCEVQELLDDMLSGIKLELRNFVRGELKEVEDNIKARIRAAVSRATLSIDLDDESSEE